VGSYDLNIETTAGPVLIRVFTPLSDVPDIVEKRAALTGESEQRVKEKMGLVSSSGRATISIDLPSVYYEGQTLELSMPVKPGPQRSYAWFMNGELVAESREVSAISYTFTTPGEYVLTYLETEEADGKVAAMGQATAYTRVVAMPPVRTEVAAHTEMTFLAPPGYQQHAWRVDGLEVSTASELKAHLPYPRHPRRGLPGDVPQHRPRPGLPARPVRNDRALNVDHGLQGSPNETARARHHNQARAACGLSESQSW
jgi:hypothetical protein